MVVSRKMTSARADRRSGGATTVSSVPGSILLHLHRNVEHLERAGRVQPIHRDAENLRVHVVDLAFDDDHPVPLRTVGGPADEDPQHVGRAGIVAFACAVADLLDGHLGNGPERVGIARRDQRAGRRHQLFLDGAAVDRRVAEELHRGRRRHRKQAVRRLRPCRRRRSAANRRCDRRPTHSSANTAPTMSMIESSAPTSCRWTFSTGIW